MNNKIVIYLSFSIILIFLFSSCELITSLFTPEKEDEEIGEFEDINIFDRNLLPDWNSFITEFSIVGDENYLYAVTDGREDVPAKIVKIKKNGESPVIKTLLDEAMIVGYTDSHAYEIESIDYYNNQLIIKAVPNILQFAHGEFEIFCLNPEDLSLQWRWKPEENGRLDYHATGCSSIPRWKDNYLIYYAEEDREDGYYFVFLDTDGNEIFKRYIQTSRPKDEGNICIIGDKIFLHQKLEPLIIYDLNKLLNPDYNFKECIDYAFTGEDRVYEANLYSNIVTDGETCYFCSWKTLDWENCNSVLIVYAVSLNDYRILWSYEMPDDHFGCVNSILLDRGKLFLAADYGCVYCLNAKNGNLNWKTKIADEPYMTNLLCEGCVTSKYFVIPNGSNSFLYYFDIKNGAIKGQHYIPVFGGKRHCYVEDDYVYITTGSYISRLRLKEK